MTGTDFPVAGRTPSKPKEPKAPKEAKPAANKKAPTKEKKPVDVSTSHLRTTTTINDNEIRFKMWMVPRNKPA